MNPSNYILTVTQQHINDAKASIVFRGEEKTCCPVSLALYQQFSGGQYLVHKRKVFGKIQNQIRFYNPGEKSYYSYNMFEVAETIKINSSYFTKRISPDEYISLTPELKKFIIEFDNGLPV